MLLALLFGSLSAIILQLYKWLSAKYGSAHTMQGIYIGSFVLAIAYAVLLKENIISKEMVAWVVSVMVIANGVYEMIIKNLYSILFNQNSQS